MRKEVVHIGILEIIVALVSIFASTATVVEVALNIRREKRQKEKH